MTTCLDQDGSRHRRKKDGVDHETAIDPVETAHGKIQSGDGRRCCEGVFPPASTGFK